MEYFFHLLSPLHSVMGFPNPFMKRLSYDMAHKKALMSILVLIYCSITVTHWAGKAIGPFLTTCPKYSVYFLPA